MASAADLVLISTHEILEAHNRLAQEVLSSVADAAPLRALFDQVGHAVRRSHQELKTQLEAMHQSEAKKHKEVLRAAERRFEAKVVAMRRAFDTRVRDVTAVLEHQRGELQHQRALAASAMAQIADDKDNMQAASPLLRTFEVARVTSGLEGGDGSVISAGHAAVGEELSQELVVIPKAGVSADVEASAPAIPFVIDDDEEDEDVTLLRAELSELQCNLLSQRNDAEAAAEEAANAQRQWEQQIEDLEEQLTQLASELSRSRIAERLVAEKLIQEQQEHARSRLRSQELQTKLQREIRSKLPRPQGSSAPNSGQSSTEGEEAPKPTNGSAQAAGKSVVRQAVTLPQGEVDLEGVRSARSADERVSGHGAALARGRPQRGGSAQMSKKQGVLHRPVPPSANACCGGVFGERAFDDGCGASVKLETAANAKAQPHHCASVPLSSYSTGAAPSASTSLTQSLAAEYRPTEKPQGGAEHRLLEGTPTAAFGPTPEQLTGSFFARAKKPSRARSDEDQALSDEVLQQSLCGGTSTLVKMLRTRQAEMAIDDPVSKARRSKTTPAGAMPPVSRLDPQSDAMADASRIKAGVGLTFLRSCS